MICSECKGQSLDRFPLTGSDKVQKYKEKAYAVEKYGLKEPA